MSLPWSKVVDIDDFESLELRPHLQEIHHADTTRFGSMPGDIACDSLHWQCAMALRAFEQAGASAFGRLIAGIGAGTDATLFSLARRGAVVLAVDRYLDRTPTSDASPAGMLIDPSRYTDVGTPRGHVIALRSNPTQLNLPSNSLDAVFCTHCLEHLGSLEKVALAAREIGRVLKPGGVASIATEFRLDGPLDIASFDDGVILFTAKTLDKYVVQASGLTLREPLSLDQSDRTFATRPTLLDFVQRGQAVHAVEEKRALSPNLVIYHDGFLFCSVVLTLYKDVAGLPADVVHQEVADLIEVEASEENLRLITALERFQRTSDPEVVPRPDTHLLFGEVERLRAENDALRAAYDRSNAWKQWRLMRPARFVYRRVKRWRGGS